jgi:hypothetical protein
VRRNIGKYLDQHINMPPAAVVVTAVLRTQVEGSPSTDLGLHDLQPLTAAPAAGAGSSSNSSNSSTGDAADGEPQPGDHPLTQFLLRYLGWLVKPNTPVQPSGSSSSLGTADEAGQTYTDSTADSRSSSSSRSSRSSSNPEDAYAAVTAVDASSSSSSSGAQDASSAGKADSRNVAELVGSALQRLSDSVSLPALWLQHKASQTHVVETLVGVAEVSFRERTRSQALTLNPPQVRVHIYVCGPRVACLHVFGCTHGSSVILSVQLLAGLCVAAVRWSQVLGSRVCLANWDRQVPGVPCIAGCARLPTQHY